jgi:pyruvate/2-oxoglutarate dehydrogenase complex dihydrolipoamide dehydrogenase (E3) component
MDEDVGRVLDAALIDEGIEVVTDAQWLRATRDATGRTVWVMKDWRERSYTGEVILQAIGRRPNIEGLHLDLAEVTVDDGRIVVDGTMRTLQAQIYAVGDVNDVTPIVYISPSNRERLRRTTRRILAGQRKSSTIVSMPRWSLWIPRSPLWDSTKPPAAQERFPI